MFVALILSIPMLVLISLSVFGGGQVFMPVFEWFWKFLNNQFNLNISEEKIVNIFTVSNTTPGVVSTKFGFLTGYLVANGQWWMILAVLLTYIIFCIPAIIIMVLAMKYVDKFKSNTYMKNLLIVMKPIVAGIMIALAIQLFLGIIEPSLSFNKSTDNYFKIKEPDNHIFTAYKNILLKFYVLLGIPTSIYLIKKLKSLFLIILINIIISLILFAIPYA